MRSVQSFQMIMNLLVMPLYFLSGAMVPLDSAPAWMQALMVLDPLTYGVDALRHVVLSGVELPAGSAPLVGLVRCDMLTDLSILGLMAVPLVGLAAVQFNRARVSPWRACLSRARLSQMWVRVRWGIESGPVSRRATAAPTVPMPRMPT